MGQAELILVMPVVVKAPSKRRRRLRRSVFIGLSLPRNRTTRRGRLQQIRRGYQVPYRGRRDDFAFTLCASAFSGFYRPLMALVWLLILRGIAIEFRNQIQNAAWERLWDVVFSASSTLVVISFGAALGNRGPRRAPRSVGPLLSSVLEQFFHWSGRGHPHRSSPHPRFSPWRNTEPCGWRSKQKAPWSSGRGKRRGGLWWGVLALAAAITAVSFRVEPHLDESFRARRWRIPVPPASHVGPAGDEGLLGSSGVRKPLAPSLSECSPAASIPTYCRPMATVRFPDDLQRGHARLRSGSGADVVGTRNLARGCLLLLHLPELFG